MNSPGSVPDVRRTPEQVVEALQLGPKVSFSELLHKVTLAHGKPIILRSIDKAHLSPATGLWLEKDDRSIILLPEDVDPLHRNHSCCHEFGHMLLNHDGCGSQDVPMPSIFHHLGKVRGIKRMLARSLNWNDNEVAAERVAYLLSLALLGSEPTDVSDFERVFE